MENSKKENKTIGGPVSPSSKEVKLGGKATAIRTIIIVLGVAFVITAILLIIFRKGWFIYEWRKNKFRVYRKKERK